ncbi:NAD(P)-dependent oxidoreductase [Streptomyces sp. SID3343]|uniref:NAD-dependent epimerase/dehydratase family protein n=1 Tax=Streptomyces sp. SID3343 TaxID=2690260 RepID=UPI00136E6279|nr:NAD(P)-dependent oxidoreductase [Streptomyces sp. SID3343]MYW02300.1 NAD-dependent epimerase/dehydratase family protein [Streptomyces sp. SID3343]
MLSGEKILITGPAGQIAYPLTEFLSRDNEVWGIARFSNAEDRGRVDALGVTTRAVDLGSGDFDDLPEDFTYVLHLATFQGPGLDYDEALRVNAEGTGLLLQHCRRAKAALVMSTASVFKPHEDPMHVFRESDPLGDSNVSHAPTYSVSKTAEEAVSRYCARAFDLPVVIARMNASYGPGGGLPTMHLDAVAAGEPVVTRWDPCMYSPIHQDDINGQTAALLDAASTPATVVNWGGDEPVAVQEWAAHMGELTGTSATVVVRTQPGTLRGQIQDTTRRAALTGPCTVDWRTGLANVYATRQGGSA